MLASQYLRMFLCIPPDQNSARVPAPAPDKNPAQAQDLPAPAPSVPAPPFPARVVFFSLVGCLLNITFHTEFKNVTLMSKKGNYPPKYVLNLFWSYLHSYICICVCVC